MRLFALLLALSPTLATAHGFNIDGDWVGAGLSTGYGFGDRGFLLGGELSLATLEGGTWYGGYLDTLHAFDSGQTRVSLGLEAGLLFVGVDAGMVVDTDTRDLGGRARLLLTFAMQSVYVGGLWMPDDASLEAGVLVKMPFEIR